VLIFKKLRAEYFIPALAMECSNKPFWANSLHENGNHNIRIILQIMQKLTDEKSSKYTLSVPPFNT
jgi:hypothetical protein